MLMNEDKRRNITGDMLDRHVVSKQETFCRHFDGFSVTSDRKTNALFLLLCRTDGDSSAVQQRGRETQRENRERERDYYI